MILIIQYFMVGRKMSVWYDVRKFLQDLYFSICFTVYYGNEMLANLRDQRLATSIPVNEESLLEMRLNDIINVLEQSCTMGQNIHSKSFLEFFPYCTSVGKFVFINLFWQKCWVEKENEIRWCRICIYNLLQLQNTSEMILLQCVS